MATTDRTPMGIAHLTVVPEGLEPDDGERRAGGGGEGSADAADDRTTPDAT